MIVHGSLTSGHLFQQSRPTVGCIHHSDLSSWFYRSIPRFTSSVRYNQDEDRIGGL